MLRIRNISFLLAACTKDQKALGCCKKLFTDDDDGEELEWQLSDNGAGGVWSGGADFIQFDIANDVECGGSSDDAQTGEAVMHFDVKEGEGQDVFLSMKGAAEFKYEAFDCLLRKPLSITKCIALIAHQSYTNLFYEYSKIY